ncbi:MAG: hypothetical protein E7344_04820 [Clostridiales bacterium]|nr:hypothetical protein [Clostridiales bacterium]
MDFNAMIESLMALVRHSSAAVVVYACVVCLLTEIVKRTFIPKLKIDLQKKFDPTIIFPFAFGCLMALFDAIVVRHVSINSVVDSLFVDGLTIGATSTVLYRLFASTFGNGLKKLQKDEIFALFYHELFVYSDAKQKLLCGQLEYKTFVNEIKLISQKATEIYCEDMPADCKKQKLVVLMTGLVDDGVISQVAIHLHNALQKTFDNNSKQN